MDVRSDRFPGWMLFVPMVGACIALGALGCGGSDRAPAESLASATDTKPASQSKPTTTAPVVRGVRPTVVVPPGPPPSHLIVKDLLKGTGPVARRGHKITVQFVALRWNGEPFQSSWDVGRVDPFTFRLHNSPREVIPGWERGIPGMRAGGRRELIVPPKLIYWPNRNPGRAYTKPSATLVYLIELLKVH
jgi:hypothetical protein